MGSTPQSIQSLLHIAAPDLADVLGRARFLARMRRALLDVLPAAIAAEFQVAAYDHYVLRLHVSNAAWATRLRYMDAALKQALAQRMRLQIDRIDIKVRPVGLGPFQPTDRPRYLSPSSRQHIERTAHYIEDAPLADALRRLAAAGRQDPD
ncbi:DUF721 domain-containing protein [Salinisphaera sp. Q1T1-3]|uniref:DUF721 domain-containing protein n=1 Tax=Salinisphaera sp. Q1T1-3 TaxID=2321229 RepID=UPI001313DF02|nr:DUF721 domain-containing protein [Salinisphaera sp. Q1T1-3]